MRLSPVSKTQYQLRVAVSKFILNRDKPNWLSGPRVDMGMRENRGLSSG